MAGTPQNTALILFTRLAGEEAQHKNILPANKRAWQEAVFHKLITNSQQVLAQTGLPFFIISSDNQVGTSFGEKLNQAFHSVFAQGYEQVIAIGNDCPELQAGHLLEAVQVVRDNGVVIGPDTHGGVYLLGYSRENFFAADFTNIHWQTDQVLAGILSFIPASVNIHLLPIKADINQENEFFLALRSGLFCHNLRRFFRKIFHVVAAFNQERSYIYYPLYLFQNLHFRGPPPLI